MTFPTCYFFFPHHKEMMKGILYIYSHFLLYSFCDCEKLLFTRSLFGLIFLQFQALVLTHSTGPVFREELAESPLSKQNATNYIAADGTDNA